MMAALPDNLAYVSDEEPGIARRRVGKGFSYRDPGGATIRDRPVLDRIRALAIPPAWTGVWICPDPAGHVQATGRDGKGRKQYLYHPAFRQSREQAKYGHVLAFARALPDLRARIGQDMARRGLVREKVLATIVHLLETTLIRVGNEDYARRNRSFGLTTLRDHHVAIEGNQLRFRFKGKSGREWNLGIRDRRIAAIVRRCQDLPGQRLFQYLDGDGKRQAVTSADVNAYLREATGQDITAKDFRTWAGTVLAALALKEFGGIDNQAQAKRNIKQAIEHVARRLGNTVTICRKCYVHPQVIEAYLEGEPFLPAVKSRVDQALRDDIAALRPEEAAVLALLRGRLCQDGGAGLKALAFGGQA
ncbi:DNA topoisomerase IB [Niveispirillum sp. KHB5.9]|uniref:DNA topoisomerase IB n=1 Tax=Niveispirillum sp. KHB5.9 TaxID=3400269 RepID=UPI003A84D34A